MKEFSQKERESIKSKLFEKGRELFAKFGIRKTSVEDLTKSVKIAKGSFYSFFRSKEDLYFQILIAEIAKSAIFRGNITLDGNKDFNNDPRKMLKVLLRSSVNEMDQNPILNKMLVHEEFEQVRRKLAEDDETNYPVDIIHPLSNLIGKWQDDGILIRQDPMLMANAIKCLYLLTTHREEISEAYYEKVMDFYIDMLSEKLAQKTEQAVCLT